MRSSQEFTASSRSAQARVEHGNTKLAIEDITELRLTLLRSGYEPVPLLGKKCLLPDWSQVEITEEEIRRWGIEHPEWSNTGIRTARMPSLDSDVDNPDVAKKIRTVMQGWCHNGRMLVRTGSAPRFAIPFRCETPFLKIKRELTDTNKLEILASGQLIVADGIHPDTGKPQQESRIGRRAVDILPSSLPSVPAPRDADTLLLDCGIFCHILRHPSHGACR
jgi:hypothetical protein